MNQELQDSVRFSDLSLHDKGYTVPQNYHIQRSVGAVLSTAVTNKQHHATI